MKSFPLYTISNRYARRVIGVPLIQVVCVLALVMWGFLIALAIFHGALDGITDLFDNYDMGLGFYRVRQISRNVWYGVRPKTER